MRNFSKYALKLCSICGIYSIYMYMPHRPICGIYMYRVTASFTATEQKLEQNLPSAVTLISNLYVTVHCP